MSRSFTVFACSYIVSGQLLNLELVFPEKPLLSEIRARIVNAFRAEEASIIDRSQSIAFDVALLFVYDTSLQRWRPMQPGSSADIVEGCQIYAQPRISSSVIRSICDNADAIEMQRIPPPVRDRFSTNQPSSPKRFNNARPASSPSHITKQQQLQHQHQPRRDVSPTAASLRQQVELVVSSDDDDDDKNDGAEDSRNGTRNNPRFSPTNQGATDLALAESWDEACRTLFQYLDDDQDGLVDIGEIPATLERIASRSSTSDDSHQRSFRGLGTGSDPMNQFYPRPQSFPKRQGRLSDEYGGVPSLLDETSFVAFCCKPENAGIVSGLLAFIHSCNKVQQEVEHHQRLLERIHKGMYPDSTYNFVSPTQFTRHHHHLYHDQYDRQRVPQRTTPTVAATMMLSPPNFPSPQLPRYYTHDQTPQQRFQQGPHTSYLPQQQQQELPRTMMTLTPNRQAPGEPYYCY